MLKYVHSNPKFEKRLNALKQSEKMAVSAARKAEDIINTIIQNGETPLSMSGKLTRHGEWRIRNCIKFDIGKGYRLVCVKEKEHLYLLYAGTHDDCSAWIENNRNYSPDPEKKNSIIHRVCITGNSDHDPSCPSENDPDYEDLLMQRITDKELQHIFKGLRV